MWSLDVRVLWCYIRERWRLRVIGLYLFMLVIRFVRKNSQKCLEENKNIGFSTCTYKPWGMFECSSLWCDNETQKRGLSACPTSLLLLHHESQWSNDKPEKQSSVLLLPNLSSILNFLIQICPSKNLYSLEYYLIGGYSLVCGRDYMTKAQFQEYARTHAHTHICHTSILGKTLGRCL
jgi:hypothetical protein